MLLFAASLIAPGTIILSIAGSFRAILSTNFVDSYLIAIGPAVFYVAICMTTTSTTQIWVALLLSAFYAVVMVTNVIGMLITYVMDTPLNPNLLFLGAMVGIFLLCAFMHPQEILCLLPGPMFFLGIPSGYLLLTIYSLCNLNVVSWGTREIAVVKTEEEKKKEEEEKKKKKKAESGGLFKLFGLNKIVELYEKYVSKKKQEVNKTEEVMSEILAFLKSGKTDVTTKPMSEELQDSKKRAEEKPKPDETKREEKETENVISTAVRFKENVTEIKYKWCNDPKFGKGGKVAKLNKKEEVFWRDFIDAYLLPLEKDPVKEKILEHELKSLRTGVVMSFCILNFLWIVITFLMQYLGEDDGIKDAVYIPIQGGDDPQRVEPFGLLFLVFFAVIIVLQFIGAVIHRVGTLLHLLAATPLSFSGVEENIEKLLSHGLEDAGDSDDDDTTEHIPRGSGNAKKILKQMSRQHSRPAILRQMSVRRSKIEGRVVNTPIKPNKPQVHEITGDILTKQFKRMYSRQVSKLHIGQERNSRRRNTNNTGRTTMYGDAERNNSGIRHRGSRRV